MLRLIFAIMAAAQTSGGFRFDGPLSRVISPNGDGVNDVAIVCFDNPSDSDVTGEIFNLVGGKVATMKTRISAAGSSCPAGNSSLPNEQHVDWDPRSQGAVSGGVYVYQIKAEGLVFTGTFLVVK